VDLFKISSEKKPRTIDRRDAGRTTKFATVKSFRFSELILGSLLSEFRLLCSFLWAVERIQEFPPFSFFKPRKEKPPKRPGAVTWAIQVSVQLLCAVINPISAQFVVLLWIRLIQPIWFASDLLWRSVHITPPCPRLFLSAMTRFLEKGEFSNRLCWVVLYESCLMCSEILRIRRKSWGVVKSWEFEGKILWNGFCPFHEITGFTLTLLYKVLRSENSEENSEESRLFTRANLVLRPASWFRLGFGFSYRSPFPFRVSSSTNAVRGGYGQ